MLKWIKKLFGRGENSMNDLNKKISEFLISKERHIMVLGEKYYAGEHDILNKKRESVGEKGVLEENFLLVNNKIVDNQYSKLVDQKINYILGKPMTVKFENEKYRKILNKSFNKAIKYLATHVLNNGVGWLFVYYDNLGNLKFKPFKGSEVLPIYNEDDELETVIRILKKSKQNKVEIYTKNGVSKGVLKNNNSLQIIEENIPYVNIGENGFNWTKIPVIPFRYNQLELPLITRVKSLQDAINTIISNFMDNMSEDIRNTVLVLVNYDGQDIGEFRRDLRDLGVIKINTVDGAVGDVKTLQIEVNSENYKTILSILKKAIIDNGRGYDAKDDRLSGNPNEMNIQSMYSEIDLDANNIETEFQASLEELIWFINTHLKLKEDIEFSFDRDVLINQSQTIENCGKSMGIISNETIIAKHPWVTDVDIEKERLKKELEIKVINEDIDFKGDA